MAPIEFGDRFPDLKLETVDGPVRLSERWRHGPLIVTFMRHFGCSFCREHLVHLAAADEEIRERGARTVAIFQYDAQATDSYCGGRGIPFECLGDPLREGYAEVGLGRGSLRQLMGWKVIRRGRAAYRAGGGQGSSQGGDVAQMPGTFVLDDDGRVVLSYYSTSAADNPEIPTLLDALDRAA